jgi:hypothetical protein
MTDFFFRTEDIRPEEVAKYFVETRQDRRIVDVLKGRNPTILVGSRGVGKSFLLRVAQSELLAGFSIDRVFPVYVTFSRSSLIQSADPEQFKHWMLARICSALIRALWQNGLLAVVPTGLSVLAGSDISSQLNKTKIEEIAELFENSWKNPNQTIDTSRLPSADTLKETVEDLCANLKINRIALFIDEAAHIFLPEQQREFFTLFRDLRSPYITCNAAVYPGVTSFGDTFQPTHDATLLPLERDILDSEYIANMREIAQKQADSNLLRQIETNGQNFAILAFAATGNPRVLLKTLARAAKLSSTQVNEVMREYYKTDVWSEHSGLTEKYVGHRSLIDWGRTFIENEVLLDLKNKNDQYLQSEKNSTCFFWVHRDAPEAVKEALRVLAYTGIVIEHANGIKASRGEIGTRYMVNLGCLFSLESTPAATAFSIAKALAPKRMTEFGANHSSFKSLLDSNPLSMEESVPSALDAQLAKSIDVLDISDWLKDALRGLRLNTVRDVLNATELQLQQAYYVGEIRSRRMKNAAIGAVLEYLSG